VRVGQVSVTKEEKDAEAGRIDHRSKAGATKEVTPSARQTLLIHIATRYN